MSDDTQRVKRTEETREQRTERLMLAGIMIDELTAERLDIQIDHTGKVWIHLDGITVLRVGSVEVIHATVDKIGHPRREVRLRGTTIES